MGNFQLPYNFKITFIKTRNPQLSLILLVPKIKINAFISFL